MPWISEHLHTTLGQLRDDIARVEAKLDSFRRAQSRRAAMSQADYDRLRRAIANNSNLIDSMIAEKKATADRLREIANDEDEIREFADTLERDAAKNAQEVVQSTPVENTEAAVPTENPGNG